MAYAIDCVTVWAGAVEDRPGGVAGVLGILAQAGANLEFVIARRDQPGTGVVFVSPLEGVAQTKAARKAGLSKARSLHSLRVEGPDKPGLGVEMTRALASAGINMRGISAAALGRRIVVYLAFDSVGETNKAKRILERVL